jgi:hypothetical protein
MFPGGQKRERESAKDCLRREIKEELPKLKLGRAASPIDCHSDVSFPVTDEDAALVLCHARASASI